MAGSQLKNLKAALKAHGLTGQTETKKARNGKKRAAKEYDREQRKEAIDKIREQFNPFDLKVNRAKRQAVDAGSSKVAVGKPGISKQVGEEQRKKLYEVKKSKKNREGGVLDKRFGERNKNLTPEEIMLERFTKERQANSRKEKKRLFNLDDEEDDGDGDGFGALTHMGKTIGDDFEDGDLGIEDEHGRMGALGDDNEPPRKKTKAEVMKEIIAKSKFYKHERQKVREKLEEQIDDLDNDFDDIMSELRSTQPKTVKPLVSTEEDILYEKKFRELGLEKRAAPASRTKTDEEVRKEREERMEKLEKDRLNRMNGILETEDNDGGVEDLGDDFWAGSDSENELNEDIADSDDNVNFNDDNSEQVNNVSHKVPSTVQLPCPATHEELLEVLEKYPATEHAAVVKKIINSYQPRLAEGNKEKLGVLSGILLQHILYLTDEYYVQDVEGIEEIQNALISILKTMSEKYNKAISETCREIIGEIQARLKKSLFLDLLPSDLVFFSLVGLIFSTSDHYHLVVTPCSILIGELLEQVKFNSHQTFIYGAILAKIALKYQRISKRYIPELVYFLKKALVTLLPSEKMTAALISSVKMDSEELSLSAELDFSNVAPTLSIRYFALEECDQDIQKVIFLNLLTTLDQTISLLWKEHSCFPEISLPFQELIKITATAYPSLGLANDISGKLQRMLNLNEHYPLTLQNHKPAAIPSYTPKFEENFNPEKKSYDPDRTRNEYNKMKAQIKKERKFTMKELRKDTKFEARQKIEEQKKSAEAYHAKMAHIFNQISTEEGAEKNKYEREKKLRNSKRQ
ncbi:HDL256Cp [Eremothecium sinecaudum]|uniref:HDL256Cp n=1 Tax=Eremothecium sinecaudum TaxID=45286 RepID=A0A109UZ34_9SACH|nr:HDL256Cp [Eremothecium sinecaudum]AMD20488.1 HDL256Cp [Eremothecium sinecaudum]